MASSASFTKANLQVLFKTPSDESALNINGTLSLFEKSRTFGFVASEVKNLSTLSAVRTNVLSGMSFAKRPESGFFSSFPSHINAGMGFGGYIITEGVVFTLFFSQNLLLVSQSIA